MNTEADFDVIIVGGGIGGVICLKYAKDAGLRVLLLEAREAVGGLWRDLPAWQDIQFRKEDWTLGTVPIEGEYQAHILRNIQHWVERFDLSPHIRLNAPVREARSVDEGWQVRTDSAEFSSRYLVAATGGHNVPFVPPVERVGSSIAEYHSSALRDPNELTGQQVTVVGGGASAYDLLDLCFQYGASGIRWIHRSLKWMRPTKYPKYFGTDMRRLALYQMLGLSDRRVNLLLNEDLRRRYTKAGIEPIMPDRDFDIRRDQLIPGRRGMIANFRDIERHQGEVQRLSGNTVELSNGARMETDMLLWGTGYSADFGYLGLDPLMKIRSLNEIARRCYSIFRSMDAPNLFLLAPGILESSTSAPWAYAHTAKSIMSHVRGRPVFVAPPREGLTNHFELVKLFAPHDRRNYPLGFWRVKYFLLTVLHPYDRPMPIP